MFGTGNRGRLAFAAAVLTVLAGCDSKPMTYRLDSGGKQFVVLAAGGHSALQNKQGDYVIAYALP